MPARFIIGDALEVLRTMPDQSVDLVITSPPFLNLRTYLPPDHPNKALEMGSEGSPGEFIDALLDVIELCGEKLAPHGSLAIEIGDSSSKSGGAGGDYNDGGMRAGQNKFQGTARRVKNPDDWPLPKSLCLIPELLRISLAYGFNPLTGRKTDRWRIRNVVTWARANPAVGALGDKFRRATSDMIVACKSDKRYFDLEAVRKPLAEKTLTVRDGLEPSAKNTASPTASHKMTRLNNPAGAPPLDYWDEIEVLLNAAPGDCSNKERSRFVRDRLADMYGPSDLFEISPGGFSGSHYAVFPPELIIDPIKAMCPHRVCTICGEPSRRIIEGELSPPSSLGRERDRQGRGRKETLGRLATGQRHEGAEPRKTVGWTDCECSTDGSHWRSGVVLDPFVGSGTTLETASGLGRDSIGIDLNEQNAIFVEQRVGRMFLEIETAQRSNEAAS